MYYFAYGSNTNINHLCKYCSNIKVIDIGYLKNFQFNYWVIKNKEKLKARATIEPYNKVKVYGKIIEIKSNLENLHKKEGYYKNIYNIKKFKVYSLKKNKIYNCFTYVMNDKYKIKKDKPLKSYSNLILEGIKNLGFPDSYIKKVIFKS